MKTNYSELFTTMREAEEHAAYMVATFWLESARRIIERGDRPVKLTACGYDLARSELSRDIYTRTHSRKRDFMSVYRVRVQAVQIALGILHSGRFESVRKHFEVTSLDNDVTANQINTVRRIES